MVLLCLRICVGYIENEHHRSHRLQYDQWLCFRLNPMPYPKASVVEAQHTSPQAFWCESTWH